MLIEPVDYGGFAIAVAALALTADEIEAEVRLAGYKRASKGTPKPGSFQESPKGFFAEASQLFFGKEPRNLSLPESRSSGRNGVRCCV